ncbi:MAG: insulinase family protein [Clostridia bacterium]|nr:insulinase family protein [Clostridia bacterium]
MIPVRMNAGRGKLLALKTDKFKIELLTLSMTFPVSPRKRSLCSLLFSTLKRGCVPYPDIASLSRRLDDLYDANITTMLNPIGDSISAGFFCECLAKECARGDEDLLGGTLDTLHKMLYEPLLDGNGSFREKTVEIEKKNLCDSVRASENDPKYRAAMLCREVMFRGEVSGLPQHESVERIMEITPRDISEFYREYLNISEPLFVYVGSRDADEVKSLIEEYFPELGGASLEFIRPEIKKAPAEMRQVEEEMAVLQGKLTMGFRADIGANDPDRYATMLLNEIFGGSPASKLFKNVREKQSLCYSCSSIYNYNKGAIFVQSGISNENKVRVIGEIASQFDDIKNGNISEYELMCAKRSIENSVRQSLDSPYSIEHFYRARIISGINETQDDIISALENIEKNDVARAASRFGADTCAFIRGTLAGGGEYDEESEYDE